MGSKEDTMNIDAQILTSTSSLCPDQSLIGYHALELGRIWDPTGDLLVQFPVKSESASNNPTALPCTRLLTIHKSGLKLIHIDSLRVVSVDS